MKIITLKLYIMLTEEKQYSTSVLNLNDDIQNPNPDEITNDDDDFLNSDFPDDEEDDVDDEALGEEDRKASCRERVF